jgi:hypothetical protein
MDTKDIIISIALILIGMFSLWIILRIGDD